MPSTMMPTRTFGHSLTNIIHGPTIKVAIAYGGGNMGIEIDFLPVGEKSSGGDAIALRYGDLHGSREAQTVVVIDGGYRDSGEALVDHITTHYNTDYVDFVISTHPDRDHISGLEVVLEQLRVGRLLMHLPWN